MILQRALVGAKLRLIDAVLDTKYTFPFVDANWRVLFLVTDVLGRGPRIIRGSVRSEPGAIIADRLAGDLTEIERTPLEVFGGVVHFDPWWDFRGVAGIRREWIDAVLSSNVARPFKWRGVLYKVHDFQFDDRVEALESVIAKDDAFRQRRFGKGDMDIRTLRAPRQHSVAC